MDAGAQLGGDWPRTTRVLPWSIAAFIAMIWLLPFQAIRIPVNLPFAATLDRVALLAIGLLWVCLLGARHGLSPTVRMTPQHWALGAYLVLCIASVLVNLQRITIDADFKLATGSLAVLVLFAVFFVVVSSSVRPAELQPLCTLIVVLACITAVGIIYQFATDQNLFYEYARKLFPNPIKVGSAQGGFVGGRQKVTGPARHALAAVSMMAIALPLVLTRLTAARSVARQALYGGAAVLLLMAAASTVRKTSVVAPVVVIAFVTLYRPLVITRVVPLLLAGYAAMVTVVPDALRSLQDQLSNGNASASLSTAGRTSDYAAVGPDVLNHLVFGRGYGAYDIFALRVFDNSYLYQLVAIGVVGAVAFLGTIVAGFLTARPAIASGDPVRSTVGLAAGGAAVVYGVLSALFDAAAFPQVPYLFFLFVALAAVARRAEEDELAQHAAVRLEPAARSAAAPRTAEHPVPA